MLNKIVIKWNKKSFKAVKIIYGFFVIKISVIPCEQTSVDWIVWGNNSPGLIETALYIISLGLADLCFEMGKSSF